MMLFLGEIYSLSMQLVSVLFYQEPNFFILNPKINIQLWHEKRVEIKKEINKKRFSIFYWFLVLLVFNLK